MYTHMPTQDQGHLQIHVAISLSVKKRCKTLDRASFNPGKTVAFICCMSKVSLSNSSFN